MKGSTEIEIWKAIPGYEGCYEVSDQGNIRSISIRCRVIAFKLRDKPKNLKFDYIKGGYARVKLQRNNIKKSMLVSRLVLTAFIGPSEMECDHINSITSDNRLVNLRWVTSRQNNHYALEKRKPFTSSKFIGVIKDGKSWASRIKINRKAIHLGTFKSEIEAHSAYQTALNKLNQNEKNINSSVFAA